MTDPIRTLGGRSCPCVLRLLFLWLAIMGSPQSFMRLLAARWSVI
jgi:hypothetical protein